MFQEAKLGFVSLFEFLADMSPKMVYAAEAGRRAYNAWMNRLDLFDPDMRLRIEKYNWLCLHTIQNSEQANI